MTEQERFWTKVNKNGPLPDYAPHLGNCWLWTGARTVGGYGHFRDGTRDVYAHRWAYEEEHGPIPSHLQSDHLCRVHNCVRPAHMELVTSRDNTLRGESFAAKNAVKTHCPQGHPYDLFNTYCDPNGWRYCRTCNKDRHREKYHRQPGEDRRGRE